MSLFNQLGEYGLNQVIARRLTTPGPAPSPTVEPAIFPALVLENDRPEWSWLKGERLCSAAGSQGAVAGQYAQAVINNPVGSNMIATIDYVYLLPGATQFGLYITPPAYALAPQVASVRDGRWSGTPLVPRAPTCTFAYSSSIGVPLEPIIFRCGPTLPVEYTQPIIIPPGFTFLIHALAVNIALTAFSIAWRERTAQPGEV